MSSNQFTRDVKWVAIKSGLMKKGFPAEQLGSHFLWSRGSTALKLNSIDEMIIKKYERWSINTFLTCFHEQIAGLVKGISTSMSRKINFYNVARFID